MFYKTLFTLLVTTSLFYAETFNEVNPKPTKTMLENITNAKVCATPNVAEEKISEDFKYGCFCGKYHPNIEGNRSGIYREIDKKERLKVIEAYYKVKPYDDIDAICQQHDICYFYQGKNAKVCNDAIYDELHLLVDKFKKNKKKTQHRQCRYLAHDMASVFRTIFAIADDENNIFDISSSMLNTSIILANKTFEEVIDTVIEQGSRYPKKDYKCLISNLE